ncbi:uncharacterized protein YwqG [Melghirimyces profundicolus]|uniref:Uncharacterized protein YwqG n=1 Tax=Melghirimyces profundicolus TaxID=1242148 RepID=A0A2T6C2M7_9BACL|nr:YwqG family protein [Melghirimyces profundicolus]PTX62576.1 uncharacterized protein YwqG [Melghirimyces profundicolus]
MRKTMEEKVREVLAEQGLSEMEEEVIGTLVPCVMIRLREEETVPRGSSKFGGVPDLPSDLSYPFSEGKPLPFIAQYNLAQLREVDPMSPLPDRGMLYFFATVDDLLWGAPSDRMSGKVIYADAEREELVPAPLPEDLPREVRYPERGIDFRLEKSFPNVDAPEDMEEIWFDLMDRLYDLEGREGGYHQAFGPPLELESDVFEACREQTGKKEADWVLLLQVDSDEELDMVFGNRGMIYFCITRNDLLKGNFDEACLVLQNP